MMRHLTYLAAAVLVASPLPGAAAEMRAASRVDAVTVFPSGAEIARRLDVAAEAGSHVLVLTDLPAALDPNSIRVDGEATTAMEITSLDARRILVRKQGGDTGLAPSERKRIETEIQRLTDERAALDGTIAAAEGQKALAENLSRAPLAATAKTGDAPAAAGPDWNAMFDLIGARIAGSANAVHEAQVAQRGLDERIALLKEQLQREPAEEQERTELRIFADARAAVKGSLRVRYQVKAAEWTPIYDARLTTGGKDGAGTLALARRASISQSTGEDWDDAMLTLSTVRPDGATAAPDLAAMKVEFKPELRSIGKSLDGAGRMDMPAQQAKPRPSGEATVSDRDADIEEAPYQAAFNLQQRVTVKSGVGEKKLLISADELKPLLYVLAVPKLDAKAYLHAKFTHDGVAPLLPGAVSLYRDGVYIGQGHLPLTMRGEEKELGFGPDDAVTVGRVELARAKGESGIISSSATDEQHFRISVKNLHDWAMPVTVIDQMPVSEDEQIAVELLPMTTEPSERNFDDKLGVLAWNFELAAQGEKEIALSYEIKWPARREVIVSEY
ncbi:MULTISPECIES: mucoidy inhibitor MuiA family protein [Rhodomicrobium]|uniref:mucoidy inhibitor MuiA family protein n=1 Tax=Rhodomicrobium TaxID=1068 RepID=UPI00148340B0|nr:MULTISPECIES: mucoidy inhibitor MuiA family protein [Rhodomicrobium]